MAQYQIPESDLMLNGARIGIVFSRYNQFIGDPLLQGALEAFTSHGIDRADIDVVQVPGAFEVPLAAKVLAASRRYDGILALGAVIRGDTPHFEYVAGECARGISQVSLEFDIPVGFGVLTVDTVAQAEARAGGGAGNKGTEAAMTVIEMINLLRQLRD